MVRAAAPLAPMDLRVLAAVRDLMREKARTPSYKEICKRVGHDPLHTGNIGRALRKLERAGKIERGIRIIEDEHSPLHGGKETN
jgi:predicted MarR family transcription regulator